MTQGWPHLQGRRILVVDDSRQITDIVATALSRCGARVAAANSGWEAMRHLRCERPDLVILDLAMPVPDGWHVLQFIRRVRPDLMRQTIVLTARRYDNGAVASLRELGIPYMFKPFALDGLRGAASRLLAPGVPSLTA